MANVGEMIKVKANGKKYSYRKLQGMADGTLYILYHGQTLLITENADGTFAVVQNEAAAKVSANKPAPAPEAPTEAPTPTEEPKAEETKVEEAVPAPKEKPKAKGKKGKKSDAPGEAKEDGIIEPSAMNPAVVLDAPVTIVSDEDSVVLKMKAELEKAQEEASEVVPA